MWFNWLRLEWIRLSVLKGTNENLQQKYTGAKLEFGFLSVKRTKLSWIIGLLMIRDGERFFTFWAGCLESKDFMFHRNNSLCCVILSSVAGYVSKPCLLDAKSCILLRTMQPSALAFEIFHCRFGERGSYCFIMTWGRT